MNPLSIPSALIAIAVAIFACIGGSDAFTTTPSKPPSLRPHTSSLCTSKHQQHRISTALASSPSASSQDGSIPLPPKTFREGEVLGLRAMQDGRYEDALRAFNLALTLPGSRPDIVRTANVSGPSPVGGSKGGTEGRNVQGLDEFEYQAAHYNMACAHAALGNVGESVANLKKAFEYGFDNYATVRADPDLGNVQGTTEFDRLMEEVDPRGRFNPFGVFGK